MDTVIKDLYATAPMPLSFAPDTHVRAFLLRRDEGNIQLYAAAPVNGDAGGIERRYLGHQHEAGVGDLDHEAPLFVHRADEAATKRHAAVAHTFTKRHHVGSDFEVIPIPGHTPGSTAYLWDTGEHRVLFTADTLYLNDGEWRAAVLDSSDREAYIASLELIRELDFDVLVPWAASAGDPPVAFTDAEDRRRRIDAIIDRVRAGADH